MKTYKIIFTLFATMILGMFILIGCSNDDKEVELNNSITSASLKKGEGEVELDLTNLVLEEEVMNNVLSEIRLKKDIIHELRDDEVKEILNPLLENGRVLHREMIFFLEENEGFEGLSPEEYRNISYLTDEQLIELSFITYNQHQYATASDIDWERVIDCASFAVGVQGIKTLYTDTLALGTVETVIGALKIIGRRYLGYIGIALMIYDFTNCLYGRE